MRLTRRPDQSFDYPGDYPRRMWANWSPACGPNRARRDRHIRAVGDCTSLGAGMRVTLSGDKVPGTGETYLCLSASHHFVSEAYGSGRAGQRRLRSPVPCADARHRADGAAAAHAGGSGAGFPQTAEVVGEGEIDCDEYGRILVRFLGSGGAHSMRCRVS